MKKFFILALIFLLARYVTILSAELEKKYDRFTQKTTISTKTRGAFSSRPSLILLAIFPGEIPIKPPEDIMVGFYMRNDSWEYLSCHDTGWLLDGKPIYLGEAKHFGDVLGDGNVLESVYCTISFAKLKQLASAKMIEAKICNNEITLTEKENNDIKELSKLLIAAKAP